VWSIKQSHQCKRNLWHKDFLLIKLIEPHGLYFHFQDPICISLSEALSDKEHFSISCLSTQYCCCYYYYYYYYYYYNTAFCCALSLFQFLNPQHSRYGSMDVDQDVARLLFTNRITKTQNKCTQISMPQVGSEDTNTVFRWAKTVHDLDRASTLIGEEYLRNNCTTCHKPSIRIWLDSGFNAFTVSTDMSQHHSYGGKLGNVKVILFNCCHPSIHPTIYPSTISYKNIFTLNRRHQTYNFVYAYTLLPTAEASADSHKRSVTLSTPI
jgi:hypothetical protein